MPDRPSLETLEPVIEAVREGLEDRGWTLSGMQKTTSFEYEGRWAGETSRSAYLFFHKESRGEGVSIDAFVDETSRGLRANLALVMELPPLGSLPAAPEMLDRVRAGAERWLMEGYRTPVSLRFRLSDTSRRPGNAETEVRIKLTVPKTAFEAGSAAVSTLAGATADAFEQVLQDSDLATFVVD
jgi:hypothetical protein